MIRIIFILSIYFLCVTKKTKNEMKLNIKKQIINFF